MKILVADDEDACRKMLQDLLAPEPFVELSMARDGAEAWWMLSEPNQHFDLCILDVKMPVVDGLTLTERIRATPAFRHLPVILCSGVSDRETVSKAVRLGINQYVVKPYNPAAMREKVRAFSA